MATSGQEHRMQSGDNAWPWGGQGGFLEVATSKRPLSGYTAAPPVSCSGARPPRREGRSQLGELGGGRVSEEEQA